jgi:hypothetical protein
MSFPGGNLKTLFLLLGIAGGVSSLSAAVLFPQCPAVGAATGCDALITISANGSVSVANDPSQPAIDSSDDQIIGVLNNSKVTVSSLPLSGSDLFGFEADGMCDGAYSPAPAGNCKQGITTDPYDYAGDLVTFTVTDSDSGIVNFLGGLAPGASAYFSLEGAPSAGSITTGPPSTGSAPEPASYALFSAGGLGLYWLGKGRSKRA